MTLKITEEQLKKKVIVPPHVYKVALKRWGKDYCDEHLIEDKKVPKK